MADRILQDGEAWEFSLKRGATFSMEVEAEETDLNLYDLFVRVWAGDAAASEITLEVGSGIEIDGADETLATFTLSAAQTAALDPELCWHLEMYGVLISDPTVIMPLIDNGLFTVIDCSPELRA